jgi:DNA-binding transcriptional LysR family regulator
LPVAYKWISRFYKEFNPQNMKLQHSSPETLEASLLKGQFDFGFSDKKPNRSDLLFEQIDQSTVRFYVSADWNNESLAELLKRLPLLVCRSEGSTEALIEHALQEIDILPSSVISSDFPSVLVDLCRTGVGVGAFCEEPISKLNTQSIRSLRNPKDAPKIETKLFVIWAAAAENTIAISHLKKIIDEKN